MSTGAGEAMALLTQGAFLQGSEIPLKERGKAVHQYLRENLCAGEWHWCLNALCC